MTDNNINNFYNKSCDDMKCKICYGDDIDKKCRVGRPIIHDDPVKAKKKYDCDYIVNRYHNDPEFRARRRAQAKKAYEKSKIKKLVIKLY